MTWDLGREVFFSQKLWKKANRGKSVAWVGSDAKIRIDPKP